MFGYPTRIIFLQTLNSLDKRAIDATPQSSISKSQVHLRERFGKNRNACPSEEKEEKEESSDVISDTIMKEAFSMSNIFKALVLIVGLYLPFYTQNLRLPLKTMKQRGNRPLG